MPGGPRHVLAPVDLDAAAPVGAGRGPLAAPSATPGSARIPARSSRGASADGRPSRQGAAALGRAHPSASGALGPATEATDGTGTSRLQRRKPTAFPTEPLPFPEQGSRHLDSKR